jgi:hypothetical protein
MSRRWWIRYLRGRLLLSAWPLDAGGVDAEAGVDAEVGVAAVPAGSDEVPAVGCARRAARCEADGSAGTWLGASCWTSARRRPPSGLFSLGEVDGPLSGELLSYSADGSEGYPLDAVGAAPVVGAAELHPVGALAGGRLGTEPPRAGPAGDGGGGPAGLDWLCDGALLNPLLPGPPLLSPLLGPLLSPLLPGPWLPDPLLARPLEAGLFCCGLGGGAGFQPLLELCGPSPLLD